jgi:hypothetical protein
MFLDARDKKLYTFYVNFVRSGLLPIDRALAELRRHNAAAIAAHLERWWRCNSESCLDPRPVLGERGEEVSLLNLFALLVFVRSKLRHTRRLGWA